MLIAIDESGSPAISSTDWVFFVAVLMRHRRSMLRAKQTAFLDWERSLPRELKNHKGEIKGASVSESGLVSFVQEVMLPHPRVLVSPVGLRPSDNPLAVVDKHRQVQSEGIERGADFYSQLGREAMAQIYKEFGHWFRKLSYDIYLKIVLLGECIVLSLNNAFGHCISGGYDLELTRLQYMIDRDFVREERSDFFWHELLRNQLWYTSKRHPLPLLDTWSRTGHPVLDKYTRDRRLDLNDLFWKNLSFVRSYESLEVRIADVVAAIFTRFFNRTGGEPAYNLLRQCIAERGHVPIAILKDFDLSAWTYEPTDNPWLGQREPTDAPPSGC